jgi:hypothetical protein
LISFDHFQNCLGMHEKHRITNLIWLSSKLITGSPPRTF